LVSFELGDHNYSVSSIHYLQEQFPGRLELILGDSTKTIPTFKSLHPDFKCDVIFIDGGHTYEVALEDIRNMAGLAAEKAWVAIDDIGWHEVTSAVETAVKEGLIDMDSQRTFQDYCRQISWVSPDHFWLTFGVPMYTDIMIARYSK